MKASERLKLYEWMDEHKTNHGAEKVVNATAMDYITIRRRINDRKEYIGYELLPCEKRELKIMRVFIK